MRYPTNIESTKYGRPYHVGYDGSGNVYRIYGDARHGYTASPSDPTTLGWTSIRTVTLEQMGETLAKHSNTTV